MTELRPGGADTVASLAHRLGLAGFVAAEEEAELLVVRSGGDAAVLASLVDRRLTGEPLAWITGSAAFCELVVAVRPGVYVPRAQSEDLARRAVGRLPAEGTAVDLCTGSGAVALVLAAAHPAATVVAVDADPVAVACARANGVDVRLGDLFAALPRSLVGVVDVVVGVVPYVPTEALGLLARDHLAFESPRAYDGGPGGTVQLRRVVAEAGRWLRPGGVLLLELGGDQGRTLADTLRSAGFVDVAVLEDEDGDVRGIEAVRPPRPPRVPAQVSSAVMAWSRSSKSS